MLGTVRMTGFLICNLFINFEMYSSMNSLEYPLDKTILFLFCKHWSQIQHSLGTRWHQGRAFAHLYQFQNKNLYFYVYYSYSQRFNLFSSFEQNKNVIYISFIKHSLNFPGQSFTHSVSWRHKKTLAIEGLSSDSIATLSIRV